jgi:hypothetical protein
MSRTDTLPTMPAIRSNRTLSRSLAVLIEVPAVKARPIKRTRAAVSARGARGRPQVGRPRRRLRREVRVAGCALLTLAPLVSLCTLGWSSRPSRILACSISDPTDPAVVSQDSAGLHDLSGQKSVRTASPFGSSGADVLSAEPAAVGSGVDSVVPVILPGYILPDDGLEDGAHEGS